MRNFRSCRSPVTPAASRSEVNCFAFLDGGRENSTNADRSSRRFRVDGMTVRLTRRERLVCRALLLIVALFVGQRYVGILGYRDFLEFRAAGRHELGHGLWFGSIVRGDDLALLIQEAPPTRVSQLEKWTWATYHSQPGADGEQTYLNLTAYDGKLVEAYLTGKGFTGRLFVALTDDEYRDLNRVLQQDYQRRARGPGPETDVNP